MFEKKKKSVQKITLIAKITRYLRRVRALKLFNIYYTFMDSKGTT